MKSKRFLALILSLLMLTAMLPSALAETNNTYDGTYNGPYEFTQQGTVTPAQPSQGDTSGSSGGHTHNWHYLKMIEEATCTSYGMATQVCYDCRATPVSAWWA